MKFLGVDYGEKKIGLAVAESFLASPLLPLRIKSFRDAVEKLKKVVLANNVDRIVVGVSEGKSAKKAVDFGKKLKKELEIKIYYQDETLSTHEAQEKSKQAGIRRIKRKRYEDSYAATIILQNFLDKKKLFD